MDMDFGPDGALYVLDYGTGWFGGDEHSALYRIENATDGRSPIAEASGRKTSGTAPLKVTFSSAGTTDPDGDALTYAGTSVTAHLHRGRTRPTRTPPTAPTPRRSPSRTRRARPARASVRIIVGNTAPKVTLDSPPTAQLFDFGDAVPFKVTVTDPEDGTVDCSKVKVTYILGHDSHGHPETSANGCSGTINDPGRRRPRPQRQHLRRHRRRVHRRRGRRPGGARRHDQHVLQPRHRQAEHFTGSSGVSVIDKAGAHGGRTVGDIHNDDWISFTPYNLTG